MDLRRRLVTYLGALLVGLLLMVLVVNVITLRYDVNNEIMASEQLVNVLLNIGKASCSAISRNFGKRTVAACQY